MANYNYHDKSDLDIHIIIDFSQENQDVELVKNATNAIKWKWNEQHNITIAGHDIELYIQDASEEHTASGVYSLLYDKWVVVPTIHTITTSELDVTPKVDSIVRQYNDIEARVNDATTDEELDEIVASIDELRYKALHLRKDAFSEGEDEFSAGNLAFKELRNNGTIEKLLNLETRLYDKKMTISDEADASTQTYAELRRAIINFHKNCI
jgi:hypothetical protein